VITRVLWVIVVAAIVGYIVGTVATRIEIAIMRRRDRRRARS
jgi:hypothetical protein